MFSIHEALKERANSNGNKEPVEVIEISSPSQQMTEEQEKCLDKNGNDENDDRRSSISSKSSMGVCSKRNIFVSFYLICLIGCLYQMIEVLILYFQYKTVTNLTIEKSRQIIPPSTSICFPYISLINLTLLFEKFPRYKTVAENILQKSNEKIDYATHMIKNFKKKRGFFDWEFGVTLEKELTIKEILSTTHSLDVLFDECRGKSPFTYEAFETHNLTKCEEIWIIDEYVKDENKCFLFKYKPVPNLSYTYVLERLANSFAFQSLVQSLRFDSNKMKQIERVHVYLHPYDRLPYGREDTALSLKYPGKNISYTYSYARTTSRLLEKPYHSDCKDYRSDGYESRSNCIEECTLNKSIELYQRAPFNLVFKKDADVRVIGFKELHVNLSLSLSLQDIYLNCRSVCPNEDCDKENFEPRMMLAEDGTKLKFSLEIPASLDIDTELSPKLTFLEYIIYNTSVFGFWFGLCVIQIADFIEYLREKKRRLASKIAKNKSKVNSVKVNSNNTSNA